MYKKSTTARGEATETRVDFTDDGQIRSVTVDGQRLAVAEHSAATGDLIGATEFSERPHRRRPDRGIVSDRGDRKIRHGRYGPAVGENVYERRTEADVRLLGGSDDQCGRVGTTDDRERPPCRRSLRVARSEETCQRGDGDLRAAAE